MNIDELLYFLRTVQNVKFSFYDSNREFFFYFHQQTIIKYRSEDKRGDFSLQPVVTTEQIQQLIYQFEPNIQLQEKLSISLNGLPSFS